MTLGVMCRVRLFFLRVSPSRWCCSKPRGSLSRSRRAGVVLSRDCVVFSSSISVSGSRFRSWWGVE